MFLDLAKAFDTVVHQSVFKALQEKGVPRHVITLVKDLYSGASTQIRTPVGKTRQIQINAGVKQVCPLSPILLNLVLDSLIWQLQATGYYGIGTGGNHLPLNSMPFANDLILLSNDAWQINELMKICEIFFDSKSLRINAKRCHSKGRTRRKS